MSVLVIIATVFLIAIGLVGIVIPFLPGIIVIWAGIALYSWQSGWEVLSVGTIVTLGIITVVLLFLDYVLGIFGAKAFGASRYGIIGAIIGLFLGFTGGPVGVIVGPIIGAFVGELFAGKTPGKSSKAAIGTALGIMSGMVVRLMFGLVMIGIFVVSLF